MPVTGESTHVLVEPRRRFGVWLGRRWGGAQHVVFDAEDKVLHESVRAIQRRPAGERWSLEAVQQVAAWPRLLDPEVAEPEARIIPEEAPRDQEFAEAARRAPLRH